MIEDIETELQQKGPDYWKYLIAKCLEDKSLDVLEHFTLTITVEGVGEVEMGALAIGFPYLRSSRLSASDWLVSLNARTLVELWRSGANRVFAKAVISELDRNNVCPIFNALAFGGGTNAG